MAELREILKPYRAVPSTVADANELAAILHVHPRTLWRLAKNRTIPAFRVGRAVRFDVRAVLEVLGRDAAAV